MAIAYGGVLCAYASFANSAGTNSINTAANLVAGDLVIVSFITDSDTTNTDDVADWTVTGGGGNITWATEVVAPANDTTTGASVVCGIATGRVTGAVASGSAITIDPVTTAGRTLWQANWFTGVSASNPAVSSAGTSSGSSSAPSVTNANPLNTELCFGILALESTTGVFNAANDSDTTNGSWVNCGSPFYNGGSAPASLGAQINYKICTGTGSQTFNIGLSASREWSALLAVIPEATSGFTIAGEVATASADGIAGSVIAGHVVAGEIATASADAMPGNYAYNDGQTTGQIWPPGAET